MNWLDHASTGILGVAAAATTYRKVARIVNIVKEILACFIAILMLAAGQEGGAAAGADKKAAVLVQIKAILADPKEPLNWPSFLAKWEDTLLGLMIDSAVGLANRSGFFDSSASASSSSASLPPSPAPAQA